jgi:hypothetical protein
MPPDKLFFADWNRDRFLSWAEKVGKSTKLAVQAILDRAVIEQQAYRSCFGLFSLKDKYGDMRLERACGVLLSRTAAPTYQQVKNILSKDMDSPKNTAKEEKHKPSAKRGFQRGAEYFGGSEHADE